MRSKEHSPFILIADDNEDLAATLSLLISIAGYEAAVVHDGETALRIAQTREPDILLLDIGLPKLNGFQVAERLRRDERLKTVRIIAISGYSPEMVRERVNQLGFDYHLVKPVDFNELLPLIHSLSRLSSAG